MPTTVSASTFVQDAGVYPVIPETLLHNTISSALQALRADTSVLDELFAMYPANVRAYIRTYFDQHAVTVRYNYPRPDALVPSVHIIVANETEDVQHDLVGDLVDVQHLDTDGDDIPNREQATEGYASDFSIQVMCMAPADDVALYLFQIVRRIVFASKMALEQAGLLRMTLAGSDFRFEPDYFSEFIYSRALTVNGMSYFTAKATAFDTVVKAVATRHPDDV